MNPITSSIDHFATLAHDSELAKLAVALTAAVDCRDPETVAKATMRIAELVKADQVLAPFVEPACKAMRAAIRRNAERN